MRFPVPRLEQVIVSSHLIKPWIVSLPDASPLVLPRHCYPDNGFDVDAWKLSAFNDTHTNLNQDAEDTHKHSDINILNTLICYVIVL